MMNPIRVRGDRPSGHDAVTHLSNEGSAVCGGNSRLNADDPQFAHSMRATAQPGQPSLVRVAVFAILSHRTFRKFQNVDLIVSETRRAFIGARCSRRPRP